VRFYWLKAPTVKQRDDSNLIDFWDSFLIISLIRMKDYLLVCPKMSKDSQKSSDFNFDSIFMFDSIETFHLFVDILREILKFLIVNILYCV